MFPFREPNKDSPCRRILQLQGTGERTLELEYFERKYCRFPPAALSKVRYEQHNHTMLQLQTMRASKSAN